MSAPALPSSLHALAQRVGRFCGRVLLSLGGLLYVAWSTYGMWLQLPRTAGMYMLCLVLWLLAWLAVATFKNIAASKRWLVAMVLVLAHSLWWWQIAPRQDRDWADDVVRQTYIVPNPSAPHLVQVHDVRNFDWRSETDYTPRWETRDYDLNQLRSVDVALSYWMGPAIAHTLVSFGFADGQQLVFSIEIRKERHEQFDAVAGFFKQYEMALIAADERDILAVRTNARGEQVRLYRVHMAQPAMRDLFMAYATQAQALREQPRFYHTLTANCTTIVWQLARRIGQSLPLDWRLLASGYLPEYLRDVHGLLSPAPLATQSAAGDITALAQVWQPPSDASDAARSADFSRHIRQPLLSLLRDSAATSTTEVVP
ncbi:MAG: DUF4105 domain-containing protein [Comamonas sp.]